MMQKTQRKLAIGFTLIELLVVISIIAVLTAILLPNLVGIRGRAADARKKADLKDFQAALRLYYNDTQSFPPDGDLKTYEYPAGVTPFTNGTYSSGVPEGTYDQLTDDSYNMYVVLDNTADPDIAKSKLKCGITGDSDPNYYVCAR